MHGENRMLIEFITVGVFQSNCYLLIDEDSHEALVIDPGEEPDRILAKIEELGVTPVSILLTHAHLDHIMAVRQVKERYGVDVVMHADDQFIYSNMVDQAARFGWTVEPPPPVDRFISDGDKIAFRGTDITVIHTPGHSPGGVSFLLDCSPYLLFAGDALFAGSIGRTDLPGGDQATLLASIKDRILSLSPETVVYPGHGTHTTIGHESRTNPFLTVAGS